MLPQWHPPSIFIVISSECGYGCATSTSSVLLSHDLLGLLLQSLHDFCGRPDVFYEPHALTGIMPHSFDVALHRLKRLAKAIAHNRGPISFSCDDFAFVWALSAQRAPGLLPHLDGAVAQGAMSCVLPTHVKERRIDSIGDPSSDQFLLISVMGQSFLRGDE